MTETSSRKRSLITNTAFSLLSWFLPIIIGFVATPLIVRKLGNRDYGLYSILLGFVSYSFTFGIGRVLIKFIAEYRASGEREKIGEVVSATFWFSSIVAVLGITVVALSARFIAVEILSLPADQIKVGENGLYLVCASIVTTMLSQIFQFILQGLHRFGPYLLLTNISGLLVNAGNVTLAYLGYGVESLLTWNLITICIMAAAFGINAVKHLPEFRLFPIIRNSQWSAVLSYGSNIILYQIFGNVLVVFERAWIVRKFGSEAATYYIVPMTLAIYLHGIVSSFTLVLFPLVNELLVDRERLIILYEKASKMTVALILFLSTMLICGGKPLLRVWINAELSEISYPLLVIHTLTFSLIAGMVIIWQLSESFRRPVFNSLSGFIWMAAAIPLMVLSADSWNIAGIAASRLIGVAITLPLLFIIEKYCLGGSRWRFWVVVFTKTGFASIIAALILSAFLYLFDSRYIVLAAGFILGGLAYVSTLFLTRFFTKDERDMLVNFILKRN